MKEQLERSLRYIVKYLHFFDVPEGDIENEKIKPFIELVFCYNMMPDVFVDHPRFKMIAQYIEKQIMNGDFESKFLHDAKAIAGIAILEEFSLKQGQQPFKQILSTYVEEQQVDLQLERTPFRLMDMKYSLNKANIQDNLPSYEEIYHQTILGKGLSLYYLTPMAIYSITHTIFYMTDMGRNAYWNDLLLQRKADLKILISESIVRNDLDILSELLLCCFFLKLEKDTEFIAIIRQAVDFILASQEKDGSFPAPIDSKTRNKRQRFDERYHTTLVCIGALVWFMHVQQ